MACDRVHLRCYSNVALLKGKLSKCFSQLKKSILQLLFTVWYRQSTCGHSTITNLHLLCSGSDSNSTPKLQQRHCTVGRFTFLHHATLKRGQVRDLPAHSRSLFFNFACILLNFCFPFSRRGSTTT